MGHTPCSQSAPFAVDEGACLGVVEQRAWLGVGLGLELGLGLGLGSGFGFRLSSSVPRSMQRVSITYLVRVKGER